MENQQPNQEKPKGPTFEFKLPPEKLDKPTVGPGGEIQMAEMFNPHLTKAEFNFYMIQNLTPLIQIVYGLVAEVEKLNQNEAKREEFNRQFEEFKMFVESLMQLADSKGQQALKPVPPSDHPGTVIHKA